ARRAEQVHVLAPRDVEAAVKGYEAARKDLERSRSGERVTAKVAQAQASLERAVKAAAAARELLSTTIKAREDALLAKAPEFAAEVWGRANERFRDAMVENESGDMKNAQRRAAEAQVLLRQAELTAVKGQVLGE